MKGITILCLLMTLLACNNKATKTSASTSSSSGFISEKDAGLVDPNNQIVGNWVYTVEGCVNDKQLKEDIHLNIEKSGTVRIAGNAFKCNDCTQNFKITKDQLLLANKNRNGDGPMLVTGPTCTELECMTELCSEAPKMIRFAQMDYKLNGDKLTIKQGENTFVLTRKK